MEMDRPILLLEDDASVRQSLQDLLHDHGYRTCVAGTLVEGRRVLEEHRPMVCLLDLNLPDGSGLELLREAGRLRLRVHAIVLTAFGLEHQRDRECQQRLVGWLTKPAAPEQILEMIERAVGASSRP